MTDLPIDDDGAVVHRARLEWRVPVIWLRLLCGSAIGGGALALVLRDPAPLVPAAFLLISGMSVERWRYRQTPISTWAQVRWTAGIDSTPQGHVRLDHRGLTVDHPALTEPLQVPWSALRAFAVESPQPHRRRRQPSFPVTRPPGSFRVIGSEPMDFLGGTTTTGVPMSAELASVELGRLPPNVAILFDEPRDVTIAAPLAATTRGWAPPDTTVPAARELRRLRTPGLYLRLPDHDRLRTALRSQGIREGFTSDDWRHATT